MPQSEHILEGTSGRVCTVGQRKVLDRWSVLASEAYIIHTLSHSLFVYHNSARYMLCSGGTQQGAFVSRLPRRGSGTAHAQPETASLIAAHPDCCLEFSKTQLSDCIQPSEMGKLLPPTAASALRISASFMTVNDAARMRRVSHAMKTIVDEIPWYDLQNAVDSGLAMTGLRGSRGLKLDFVCAMKAGSAETRDMPANGVYEQIPQDHMCKVLDSLPELRALNASACRGNKRGLSEKGPQVVAVSRLAGLHTLVLDITKCNETAITDQFCSNFPVYMS